MFVKGSRYERVPEAALYRRPDGPADPVQAAPRSRRTSAVAAGARRRAGRPARPARGALLRRPGAVLAHLRREPRLAPRRPARAGPAAPHPAGAEVGTVPASRLHAARSRTVPAPAEFVEDASRRSRSRARSRRRASSACASGSRRTLTGRLDRAQEDLFRPLAARSACASSRAPACPRRSSTATSRSRASPTRTSPGDSALEVTGMDATMLMNLQEKSMPWPNLPDSADRDGDLRPVRLVPKVQPTPPVLIEPEGTTIQRGTRHPLPAPARAAQRLRLLRAAGAGDRRRLRPLRAAAASSGCRRR